MSTARVSRAGVPSIADMQAAAERYGLLVLDALGNVLVDQTFATATPEHRALAAGLMACGAKPLAALAEAEALLGPERSSEQA